MNSMLETLNTIFLPSAGFLAKYIFSIYNIACPFQLEGQNTDEIHS